MRLAIALVAVLHLPLLAREAPAQLQHTGVKVQNDDYYDHRRDNRLGMDVYSLRTRDFRARIGKCRVDYRRDLQNARNRAQERGRRFELGDFIARRERANQPCTVFADQIAPEVLVTFMAADPQLRFRLDSVAVTISTASASQGVVSRRSVLDMSSAPVNARAVPQRRYVMEFGEPFRQEQSRWSFTDVGTILLRLRPTDYPFRHGWTLPTGNYTVGVRYVFRDARNRRAEVRVPPFVLRL